MPITIKNASDGNLAKVTPEGMLTTFATTESYATYISQSNGEGYVWNVAYDYDANDTLIWLRNDSPTKFLIIERITITSETVTQFIIHFPENATPAGTSITGTNLNRGSVNVAEATCYQDETNNTQDVILTQGIVTANGKNNMSVDGAILLAHNHCIAVDFVTAGTLGIVTIRGYYIDK